MEKKQGFRLRWKFKKKFSDICNVEEGWSCESDGTETIWHLSQYVCVCAAQSHS